MYVHTYVKKSFIFSHIVALSGGLLFFPCRFRLLCCIIFFHTKKFPLTFHVDQVYWDKFSWLRLFEMSILFLFLRGIFAIYSILLLLSVLKECYSIAYWPPFFFFLRSQPSFLYSFSCTCCAFFFPGCS